MSLAHGAMRRAQFTWLHLHHVIRSLAGEASAGIVAMVLQAGITPKET